MEGFVSSTRDYIFLNNFLHLSKISKYTRSRQEEIIKASLIAILAEKYHTIPRGFMSMKYSKSVQGTKLHQSFQTSHIGGRSVQVLMPWISGPT